MTARRVQQGRRLGERRLPHREIVKPHPFAIYNPTWKIRDSLTIWYDRPIIDPEWWNRDLLTGYVPSDLDEERGYWLSLSDVDLEAISSRSVATDP